MIYLRKMKYLKTFESHSIYKIVYRGTNKKLDFIKNDMVWASEEEHEASSYGKVVYELEVDLGKCFNSLELKDIQVLYDNGYYLHDSYYDDEEHEYNTAEDFCERGDSSDTWSSIEDSDGIIDFVKENYDSILITEGGYTNYILFNGRIINYREITKISENFKDVLDGYYEPISSGQKNELLKEGESFTDNEIRRIRRIYPKDIRFIDYKEKIRQLEIRGHDSLGLRTRDTITKVNHGYYIVSCINGSDIFKCDQFDGLLSCLKNLMDARYNKEILESNGNLNYYYEIIDRDEFGRLVDDENSEPYNYEELKRIIKKFNVEDYRVMADYVMIIDTEFSTINISKTKGDYFIAFFRPSSKEEYKLKLDTEYKWIPKYFKCDNIDGLLQWIKDFTKEGKFLD